VVLWLQGLLRQRRCRQGIHLQAMNQLKSLRCGG
jgi:hypothetical protein